MSDTLTLRPARPDDADALSALIAKTLRVSNEPDYGPENTARVASHFTPDLIRRYMTDWKMFVAERGQILGTASYKDGSVRAVFVDPDTQGLGVGRALMAQVIAASQAAGDPELTLRSSIFAEAFYARLGWAALHDEWNGDERTIRMTRPNGGGHLAQDGAAV